MTVKLANVDEKTLVAEAAATSDQQYIAPPALSVHSHPNDNDNSHCHQQFETVDPESVSSYKGDHDEQQHLETQKEAIVSTKRNVKPSLTRLILRVWQMLAAMGAFGFQVGASPYSADPIPFEKPDLLYCGFSICWLSFFWSSFNVFVYLSRRFGNGSKIKRFVSILFDLTLTALFGVCTFYEIATYKCKPGLHNGW
ncbi:hypothetical protein BDF20DRAFT_898320 [Mycotypha africana]|uniref:uncharacterized protein n=1 Tax=Mycotypha africana TaxID=64632 RepID=UPI0023005AA5|nr:uncharacterized protein BDF20DRAFT_898320 [Mycotypha africana]KAI8968004.1 hypothetical protein BDF20DRAFT_898320 [Mycotypha africana]